MSQCNTRIQFFTSLVHNFTCEQVIDETNRGQIIDDAFNLARYDVR